MLRGVLSNQGPIYESVSPRLCSNWVIKRRLNIAQLDEKHSIS